MRKLSKDEMKKVDGGLTYCCTRYTSTDSSAWLNIAWCTKKMGEHWDEQMRMIEVKNKKGQYMSLYGH